jgi:hypothetical protein
MLLNSYPQRMLKKTLTMPLNRRTLHLQQAAAASKKLTLPFRRIWRWCTRWDIRLRAKDLEVALCFLWVTETVKTTGWLILLKLEKQRRLGYFDWLNSNFHNIIEKAVWDILKPLFLILWLVTQKIVKHLRSIRHDCFRVTVSRQISNLGLRTSFYLLPTRRALAQPIEPLHWNS